MDKKAFSLAETWIKLAIIGVVTILVIPNIPKIYKKTEIEIQLKSTYSGMNIGKKITSVQLIQEVGVI